MVFNALPASRMSSQPFENNPVVDDETSPVLSRRLLICSELSARFAAAVFRVGLACLFAAAAGLGCAKVTLISQETQKQLH